MTIKEVERALRLPNPTTAEDLGCRWNHVLNYGDRVLLAGHYYQHSTALRGCVSRYGSVWICASFA